MLLAGVNHITIAPALLRELASTEIEDSTANLPSLFDEVEISPEQIPSRLSFVEDEEAFRMAVTRDKQGVNEGKLTQVRSLFGLRLRCPTCDRKLLNSIGDQYILRCATEDGGYDEGARCCLDL